MASKDIRAAVTNYCQQCAWSMGDRQALMRGDYDPLDVVEGCWLNNCELHEVRPRKCQN